MILNNLIFYTSYSTFSTSASLVSCFRRHVSQSLAFSNSASPYLSDSLDSSKSFHSIIPSSYVSSNNKPISIHLKLSDLNSDNFIAIINSTIPKDFVYTVFIKVRYNYDSFCMAGNQIGFNFSSVNEVEVLFSTVISRLEQYLDMYNLTEQAIVYIQISFTQKDKKLLSEFSLEKPTYISKFENILTQKSLTVPVSVNEDSIGKPLSVDIDNGFITAINLNLNNNQVNFLDLIKDKAKLLRSNHIDNITCFDHNFKFYLLKDKYDYVLAIKTLQDGSIDKIRYSTLGVIISHVTDIVENNLIIRKSGEKEIVIRGDKIVSTKLNIKTKPIEKPISKACRFREVSDK